MAEPNWFAIIDCAQDPRLEALVKGCKERLCLFKGDLGQKLSQVSPWLVRIDDKDTLLERWQQEGRGQNWGIMLLSARSLEELQRHFRKFLQAKLPDGTIALFRFYDPRVFNTFIQAAGPQDQARWFDGIAQYAVEREDSEGLHLYRLSSGQLLDGGK